MKKLSTVLILLVLFAYQTMGQKSYEMEVLNLVQVNETEFTFDVKLKNNGSVDFAIETIQWQFSFNTAILNGGLLNNAYLTYVSETTDLVGSAIIPSSEYFTTNNVVIQWVTASLPDGGETTLLGINSTKKIGTFRVQLRNSSNSAFHNFGDVAHTLAFVPDQIIINSCNYTLSGSKYLRSGSSFELLTNKTLINSLSTRELAGYYFSGTGNYETTARWNNITTANTKTVPGATNNAIIAGTATVTDARSISELTAASSAYLVLNKDARLTTDKVYNDNALGGGVLAETVAGWDFQGATVGTITPYPYLANVGITSNLNTAPFQIYAPGTLGNYANFSSSGGTIAARANNWYDDIEEIWGGWKVSLSTSGFQSLTISSKQYSVASGPKSFKLQYSLNGTSWTDITGGTISVATNWTTGVVANLGLPTAINNQSTIYLRWQVTETNTSNNGTSAIDDIIITGEPLPSGILVESSTTGTGSLIHNNTGVNATVQRYINRWSTTEEHGWHFLSSPVASQAIRPEFVPATNPIPTYIDFYKWDESHVEQEKTGWWINAKDASFNWNSSFESNFVVGRGYLMAYGTPVDYGNEAHEFIGEINVGDVTFTGLTRTSGSSYPGWHLIGNPFTSAIDWGQGSWTKTNIGAVPQIWNESSASYKVISGEGIIPANNGFMVYTSGSGTLTIPSNARVQSDSLWYKTGVEDQISLVAYDPERLTNQETIIRFNADATEGFDMEYDAMFISGFAPMFYSASANTLFALNCLTELTDEMIIPLGFVKNNSTEFNIKLGKSIEGKTVYLTDLKLNKESNLSENPVYTFTSAEGDNPNRFLLKFGTVGISEPAAIQNRLWFNDNQLYFISQGGETQIQVFDIMGRRLIEDKMTGWRLQTFPIHQTPGIYIIKVQSADVLKSIKVSVN